MGTRKFPPETFKEIKSLIKLFFDQEASIGYTPTTYKENYIELSNKIKEFTGIEVSKSYLRDLFCEVNLERKKREELINAALKFLRAYKNSKSGTNFSISVNSFAELDQFCLEQDNRILDKFRTLSITAKPSVADFNEEEYSEFINNKDVEWNLLNHLNDHNELFSQIEGLPKAQLEIIVERDLSKVQYKWNGKNLDVYDPELLWDCTCTLPAIPELGIEKRTPDHCKIHSQKNGNKLREIFSSELVKIKYAGVSVYWKNERDLWPPAIDTLLLIDRLLETNIPHSTDRSVLDIGSGTGFIGLWIGENGKHIDNVSFSDWLFRPLLFSALNATQSPKFKRGNIDFNFLLGSDFRWRLPEFHREQFDLLICNPPYLPILPGFEDIATESTVAGTTLLEKVITEGHKYSKRVVVSFSSLVIPEVEKATEQAEVKLIKIGEWKSIPFRVRYALKRPDYLKALVNEAKNNQRRFKVDNNLPHGLYHDICLHEVIKR